MKTRTEIELFLAALLIVVVCFSVVWFDLQSSRERRVVFLDVGQGDSQFIQSGAVRILQDAGPDTRAANSLDKLLSGPDRKLAIVLITHPETDHIGGLPEVLRRFTVDTLLIPATFQNSTSGIWQEVKQIASDRSVRIVGVSRGDEIRAPGLQMQILWPMPRCVGSMPTNNECALVAKTRLGDFDFLFTGDIGIKAERLILSVSSGIELAADVLKMPHHGSKNSILPQFFAAVSSSFAVVQAGVNNTYGHATPELLNRLSAYTGRLWSTAQEGAVEVVPADSPRGLRVRSWE